MNILILLAFALIVFMMIGVCIWCYWREKKDYNNGICPRCGTKLRHFGNDSQGGQGWCCDKCDYTVWISWFKGKEAEQ